MRSLREPWKPRWKQASGKNDACTWQASAVIQQAPDSVQCCAQALLVGEVAGAPYEQDILSFDQDLALPRNVE
jgi:hypothetical protein